MKQDHTKTLEWTVWANLDKFKDLELVLLKGHLILEVFVENLLTNSGLEEYVESSFFKKASILSRLQGGKRDAVRDIQHHLLSLNKIRNRFAHEWNFSISESSINEWAQDVLSTYRGEKFAKHTYRTKIIHAFSTLSGAIVEIQQ